MVLTQAFLRVLLPNGKLANHVDPLFESEEIEISLDSSMAINEFLFSLDIDNINLVKLLQYMKESNLTHKVHALSLSSIQYIISNSFVCTNLIFHCFLPLRSVVIEIR